MAQQYVVLDKKRFDDFISKLSKDQKVVAPVKRGEKNFAFAEVTSGKEVAVKYIPTILPPKKYFMPPVENILEYNKAENIWQPVLEYDRLVIFGVHTCDLAGIQCLNMVFSEKPPDINYIVRKNKILIIGLECNDYCDEYASCFVMDNHLPNGGYDLFFTELEDCFMVHINTMDGEKMIKATGVFKKAEDVHFAALQDLREKKRKIFKEEVNAKHKTLSLLFDHAFEHPVWEDLGKRCLACANCTNVCPTCYCFDILDEVNLDFNTGVHIRRWDSCQNEEFAKVAGGESFRKKRGARQRHRYMRKFQYPIDLYSRYFCTGCGRCSRTCMAKISLKETINTLAEGKNP